MLPKSVERLARTVGRRASSEAEMRAALLANGVTPRSSKNWIEIVRIARHEMTRAAAQNQEREDDLEFVSLLVYSLDDDLQSELRCPMRAEFIGMSPLNDDWHPLD